MPCLFQIAKALRVISFPYCNRRTVPVPIPIEYSNGNEKSPIRGAKIGDSGRPKRARVASLELPDANITCEQLK